MRNNCNFSVSSCDYSLSNQLDLNVGQFMKNLISNKKQIIHKNENNEDLDISENGANLEASILELGTNKPCMITNPKKHDIFDGE